MSNLSWKKQLTLKLQSLTLRSNPSGPENHFPRLVFLGVGNELNGDDAAGVYVIHSLRRHPLRYPNLLMVDAGPAPENFTGPIRRFSPDLVLIIDAVHMNAKTGSVTLAGMEDISGISALTHRLPPTVISQFLLESLACPVALLGIQAGSVEFDTQPSPEIKKAVRNVSRGLRGVLSSFSGS